MSGSHEGRKARGGTGDGPGECGVRESKPQPASPRKAARPLTTGRAELRNRVQRSQLAVPRIKSGSIGRDDGLVRCSLGQKSVAGRGLPRHAQWGACSIPDKNREALLLKNGTRRGALQEFEIASRGLHISAQDGGERIDGCGV